MTDLLEHASAWLEDQRTRHMTQTVVYQRGNDAVELPATVGRTVFRLEEGDGATIRVETRDFLVAARDLILAGQPSLPCRGDRIRQTCGTTTYLYEVTAPGDEPEWRWSDPYGKTLRIHTQQVETTL